MKKLDVRNYLTEIYYGERDFDAFLADATYKDLEYAIDYLNDLLKMYYEDPTFFQKKIKFAEDLTKKIAMVLNLRNYRFSK